MKTASLLLLTLLWPLTAISEANPPLPDYPVDRISDKLYVIHGPLEMPNPANQGFMNNPAFLLTAEGVVIVDPGSSLQSGEMVLRMLKSVTDQPVVAVFNTHIHGDHWLGNQAVKNAYPEAVIYGHPAMMELIENGEGANWLKLMMTLTEGKTAGTEVVAPEKAVNQGDSITIGDTTFRIHHNGKAHTTSDIMIEAVQPSVMFLGDNVLYNRIPRIDDGNVQGNIEACKSAVALGAQHYVPGHGPTGDGKMVDRYCDYLQTLYTTVKQYYDEGLSDFEMKPQVAEALKEYAGWAGFEEQLGRHISITYLQIEEAEF